MKLRDDRKVRLLWFVMMAFFVATTVHATVADRVLAVVNEEVITKREVQRMREPIEAQMRRSGLEGAELERQLEQLEKDVLEQLINAKLVVSLAKRREIEVDEQELNEQVDTIRSYYTSEDEFLVALNQKGLDLTTFRNELREQLLAQELIQQEIMSQIDVSPRELRKVYEENKERFIAPTRVRVRALTVRRAGGDASRRELIERIAGQIERDPDSFDELIERYSDGPYAPVGGDMGLVAPGQTVDEIDEAVFQLGQGEFSGIVETPLGYHIFRALEIERSRQLEFNEVREYVREQVHMGRFQEKLGEWLKQERENAYISYR